MAEPFHRPPPGSRPHLYRLMRDDMYHTAGTILCLTEEQAAGDKFERVRMESDDADAVAGLADRVDALAAAVERLTAEVGELTKRLSEPEPEPAPPPPPEAAPAESPAQSPGEERAAAVMAALVPEEPAPPAAQA